MITPWCIIKCDMSWYGCAERWNMVRLNKTLLIAYLLAGNAPLHYTCIGRFYSRRRDRTESWSHGICEQKVHGSVEAGGKVPMGRHVTGSHTKETAKRNNNDTKVQMEWRAFVCHMNWSYSVSHCASLLTQWSVSEAWSCHSLMRLFTLSTGKRGLFVSLPT